MRRRIVAVVLAMVYLLFCAPVLARADADMPRVDIKAIVGTDGSLNVSETRTFSFNDAANGVYWTFANGQNQQGAMSTTVVGSVSEDGVSLARVESAENGQGGVYTPLRRTRLVTFRSRSTRRTRLATRPASP